VKITFASITPRANTRNKDFHAITAEYQARCAPYADIDEASFRSENALFEHLDRQRARTPPLLIALDSRGKSFTSEEFAAWLGRQRDSGQQALLFAIGPADGWSEAARARAGLLLSFGPMTLPHELMRVVLAEQVYRAFTILAGHPYHSGH
jgi:23S rRNA (pseudouridine1915-N3)-methyltransferase